MKIQLLAISLVCYVSLHAQPPKLLSVTSALNYHPVQTVIYYRIGERIIGIDVTQYGNNRNLIYINLHDNEITSVQAARTILSEKGGTLIKFENDSLRNIEFKWHNTVYNFDPNRMFSRAGIKESLEPKGRNFDRAIDVVDQFAKRVLSLIPYTSSCIVALHNNSPGDFSIRTFMRGGEQEQDAKATYTDKDQDPDDFSYTTDSFIFQYMVNHHYNAVWQDNKHADDDGSLSVFCGLRKMRYINIETQAGRFEQHRGMLHDLSRLLYK